MTIAQKNTRIDLRIESKQKMFLTYVASLRHKKLSAFLLECALKEAEDVMVSKNHFELSEKKWQAFSAALDRPARDIPKLKNLFKGPNIFHE